VLSDKPCHFWGSPALAFGRVLAAAFRRDGWDLEVSDDPILRRLPLHTIRDGIEPHVVPCAEVVMSDATINRIAEEGLTSLATFRDSDEARFYGIQTLAGTALAVSAR
jgi:predicted component of type VI protein secretion system